MKLLIVEDDPSLLELMRRALAEEKYVVETASDFAGADAKIAGYTYDCILLDIMLPGGSGLRLLDHIKEQGRRENVIIISARDSLDDKVYGLEHGADDYLPKPFSVPELLARIRALSRRKNDTLIQDNVLTFGDLSLDLKGYRLYTAKNSVKVSVKEFEIIRFLMEKPSFIATRDDMIAKIWGFDSELESNNIEVYISFLRKKLSYIGSDVNIVTVRGVGYQLEDACSKS